VGNFYNFSIDVTLQSTGNITELINIPESSFTLQPNETKNIEYTLTISKPGIYTGGILINVKGGIGTTTITYQSDLAVIANKSKTQPELYVIITVVVILFLIIVYLKSKRHKK
jgi:hypothetical protein